MDLFVDAIDSKLQSSEKYLKLLKSNKRRKKNLESKSDDKNESGRSDDPGEDTSRTATSPPEEGRPSDRDDSRRRDEPEDGKTPPFLNFLIDTCTDVVRTTNQLSSGNYRKFLETKSGSDKVSGLKKKCEEAMEDIKSLVRKVANDHLLEENTNLLEFLFEEIEYGLKKHNTNIFTPKSPHGTPKNLLKSHSPSPQNLSQASRESLENARDPRDNVRDKDDRDLNSKKSLKKWLMKYENECLNSYSVEVDLSKYELAPRPQDNWKVNNFSSKVTDFGHTKWNGLEPQVTFERREEEERFFEKGFVPKIYPKVDFLAFVDKRQAPKGHPYAQELNALSWSEDGRGSHGGPAILGGEGNLLKLTEPPSLCPPDFQMVTTQEEFDKMLDEISQCTLLALDLEHHDVDSYHGFTCLIQLSTVYKNYIVDPFNIFQYVHR